MQYLCNLGVDEAVGVDCRVPRNPNVQIEMDHNVGEYWLQQLAHYYANAITTTSLDIQNAEIDTRKEYANGDTIMDPTFKQYFIDVSNSWSVLAVSTGVPNKF